MSGPEGIEPIDALFDTVYDLLPGILRGVVSAEEVAGDAHYRGGGYSRPDPDMVSLAEDEIHRIQSGDLSGVFDEDIDR